MIEVGLFNFSQSYIKCKEFKTSIIDVSGYDISTNS